MMAASCSTASSTVVATSYASSSKVSSRKNTMVLSLLSARSASISSVEGSVRRGPALAERLRQFQVLEASARTGCASWSSCATPWMYSDTRPTKSLLGGMVAATRWNTSHALARELTLGLPRVCLSSCMNSSSLSSGRFRPWCSSFCAISMRPASSRRSPVSPMYLRMPLNILTARLMCSPLILSREVGMGSFEKMSRSSSPKLLPGPPGVPEALALVGVRDMERLSRLPSPFPTLAAAFT
mmetsp:Transcript_22812/g.58057  ORF Transcript_22812/g.58057 Transcript_22812/m.58057 type:complete len:241 (-) Transcript_22812:281-1003(-)